MNAPVPETPSTRPYLIRAMHEWCSDNGFSPYIAVHVDGSVQVPAEYVQGGEIVLNVSFDATNSLRLGNDYIEFKARFGGVAREIVVPVSHVVAIYARENGQGMAFAAPTPESATEAAGAAREPLRTVTPEAHEASADADQPPVPPAGGRPQLKRVK